MSVENQFIVRADGVDLHERHAFVAGDALEHREPRLLLADVPRRGGQVEDEVGALGDEFLHRVAAIAAVGPEIFVVPDVFTNRDAELAAIEREGRGAFRRLEVAVLVKHVVRRQQRFILPPDNITVLEDRGGVEERAPRPGRVFIHEADTERHRAHRYGGFGKGGEIGFDEIRTQEQVAGRIAA